MRIGDTLRYLMYHDSYGKPEHARRLFRALPAEAREIGAIDFSGANRACPNGVDVASLMKRAGDVLARARFGDPTGGLISSDEPWCARGSHRRPPAHHHYDDPLATG